MWNPFRSLVHLLNSQMEKWPALCSGKNCLCRLSEMEQMLEEGDLKALALPKTYSI